MNIQIIQKPILFFQLSKKLEKISKYVVGFFSKDLWVDLGRIFVFRKIAKQTTVITHSLNGNQVLEIDGHRPFKIMYNFLNNGENK